MNKFRIYMDCCCFSRPFDDLSQEKVRLESEAVLSIIRICELGQWEFFKSDMLFDEISEMGDYFKREKILSLYSSSTLEVEITDEIIIRAKELQSNYNIGTFDAIHLASAEYGNADVLLTTDKKFMNRALQSDTKIRVLNPFTWLTEVFYA